MIQNNITEALKVLEAGKGYKELTLEEFKNIYNQIINQSILTDHTVFAAFIEEYILILFPEKPDVSFVVKKDKGFFSNEDLNFVHNLESMGTYNGELKFTAFLKKEFILNWRIAISIFLLTFISLYVSDSLDMVRKINEMILASATIFVSIFLLFVISQSKIENEFKLMKEGILYEFLQNDKFVAVLAIVAIFLSIITSGFSYFTFNFMIILYGFSFNLIILSLFLITSLSLTILAICYTAIVKYYFEREKFLRLLPESKKMLRDSVQRYKNRKVS